ncbi:hypothetical protein PAF15_03420 [Weissella koreensis]|uniref:hypothetical protein n=1 Tax=Weissella koreensis TaxID=165096 RepID=UPI0022BA5DB7|nr:hypothetical protein [Weissella koreensis]MCZ9311024.1 hypothetical protein [Weissella koreensis]
MMWQEMMLAHPVLGLWVLVLGVNFLVPVCASWLISKNMAISSNLFGHKIWWAWLGIIVHELSHAVVAIIFGHKIKSISFLQPADAQGTLGYVEHTYDPHNWYQTLGNFFIGIAPIFGISLSMYFVTRWLWPSLLTGSPTGSPSFLQGIIWGYLCLTLFFGIDLSKADWAGAQTGMLLYLGLLTIVSLICSWLFKTTGFQYWQFAAKQVVYYFFALTILSFLIRIVVTVLARLRV